MKNLFALMVLGLPIMMVIGITLHLRMLGKLRAHHHATWEDLGRPSILNNSISNGFAVQRFLWRRDYRSLGDPAFSRSAEWVRRFGLLYIAYFATLLVTAVQLKG